MIVIEFLSFLEQKLQNNGTIYVHVYITKRGKSPDPQHPKYNRLAVVNRSLCKYLVIPSGRGGGRLWADESAVRLILPVFEEKLFLLRSSVQKFCLSNVENQLLSC